MKKVSYLLSLLLCFCAFSCSNNIPFNKLLSKVNSVSADNVVLSDPQNLKSSSFYFSSNEPFNVSVDKLSYDGKLLSATNTQNATNEDIDSYFEEVVKGGWIAANAYNDNKYYAFFRGVGNTTLTDGSGKNSFVVKFDSSYEKKSTSGSSKLNVGGDVAFLLDSQSAQSEEETINNSANAFTGIFNDIIDEGVTLNITEVKNDSNSSFFDSDVSIDQVKDLKLVSYNKNVDGGSFELEGVKSNGEAVRFRFTNVYSPDSLIHRDRYFGDDYFDENPYLRLVKETNSKRYYEVDATRLSELTGASFISGKISFTADNTIDVVRDFDGMASNNYEGPFYSVFRNGVNKKPGHSWNALCYNHYFTDEEFLSTYSMNYSGTDFNGKITLRFDMDGWDNLNELYKGYIFCFAIHAHDDSWRYYQSYEWPCDLECRTRELMIQSNKNNSVYFVSDKPFSISLKNPNKSWDGTIVYAVPNEEFGGVRIPEEWDGSEIHAAKYASEYGYWRHEKNPDYFGWDSANNPIMASGDNKYYIFLRGIGNTDLKRYDTTARDYFVVKGDGIVQVSNNYEKLLDYKMSKENSEKTMARLWLQSRIGNPVIGSGKKVDIIQAEYVDLFELPYRSPKLVQAEKAAAEAAAAAEAGNQG